MADSAPAKKTTPPPPPAKKAEPPRAAPPKATAHTAAPVKTAPAPAKAPEVKPPPPVTKTAPPKAPEPKADASKVDSTSAPKPETKPAETKPAAKSKDKADDQKTLTDTAADRGWLIQEPKGSDTWDLVLSKPNPVLGGYEHLRASFDNGGKLDKLEHENLNRPQEVPDEDQLDYAVSALTGE